MAKEKLSAWGFFGVMLVVGIVATLFGMYIMPSIGVAVDPMASSNVIKDMHAEYGSHQCAPLEDSSSCCGGAGTGEQWIGDCTNRCDGEFSHNARQLGMCYTKCYDEMYPVY